MKRMDIDKDAETLKVSPEKAIFDLHKVRAAWVKSVPVKEEFQGQVVWEGIVQVSNIKGHPKKATRCYAWSSPIEGSSKRKFFAVLHVPPVASARDAVKAAIIQEYRQKGAN
jgi:hypothetical protein